MPQVPVGLWPEEAPRETSRPGPLTVPTSPPAAPTRRAPGLFPAEDEDELRVLSAQPTTTPDRAAQLFRLQTRTGLPLPVLEATEDLGALERETNVADFNADRFRRMHQGLAQWLTAHPQHFSLAQDDLAPLSGLDRATARLVNIGRATRVGILGAAEGLVGAGQAGLEVFGRSPIGRLTGTGPDAVEHARVLAAVRQRLTARQTAEQEAMRGQPGFVESALYSGVSSLAQVATAVPASVLTASPVPMLGAIGLMSGGSAYGQARDAGKDVLEAVRFGGTNAAVEIATELIPAKWLIRDVLGRSTFRRAFMRQVVSESLGEQVATVLQDLDEWATLRPDATLGDYWHERPSRAAETLIATIVTVGGMTTLAHATARAAGAPPETQEALTELGQAAQTSRTVSRAPAKVQELVRSLAGDVRIHLPVESFATYWQERGEDPAAKAEALTGDPQAHRQAVESGADLAVPLERYVTEIAGTEHNTFFAQEARVDPQSLNAREEAALDREASRQAARPAPGQLPEAPAIREAVQAQLVAAMVEPSTAATDAQLVESVFATVAARAGVDPMALWQRFNPQIVQGRRPRRRRQADQQSAQSLFQTVLEDARRQDPTVDADTLWDDFDARLAFAEGLQPRGAALPTPDVLAERTGLTLGTPWWQTSWEGGAQTFAARGGRGRITFGPSRQVTIQLFAARNLSTFAHESGHLYLELLGDVVEELRGREASTLTDTQQRMITNYDTVILPWLGVTSRAEIGTAQHEQWAEAWEDYLEAGRAPSVELRPVFRRMRTWLESLYRHLRRRGPVTITDDVRRVMDQLVATDKAIAVAQQELGATPLFSDEDLADLSPSERATYAALLEDVRDRASGQVQARLVADAARVKTTEWQQQRAEIRAAVTLELQARPVYRAWALLAQGTQPDGSPLPEGTTPFKLSTEAVRQEVGPDIVARLPKAVHTSTEGVPPSVAAAMLGYQSARGLVNDLATAQPLAEAVEIETDARMREAHGDRILDGSIVDEAERAVAEHTGELFLAELRVLGARRSTRTPVPTLAQLRQLAETRIGNLPLREIRAGTYAAAAKRTGERALKAAAAGQFDAAFTAKLQQALNLELWRAASAAQETVSAALDTFRPMLNRPTPALAKTHDINLVHAARALLVQVQIGTAGPKDQAVQTYLDQVQEYDPELFKDLEAAISASRLPAQSYRELTYDQFLGLRDGVVSLWHQAKRTREMVIAGQRLTLAEVGGQIIARLRAVIEKPTARAGYQRKVSAWQETKLYLLGMRAGLRRVEHWVQAIDGSNPRGVLRRLFWEPVSDSAARYRAAKVDVLLRYLGIVRTIESSLTTAPLAAPEINYEFAGTAELLHAILHTGNLSSRSKLLRGRGWGEVRETDGTLDTSRWDAMLRRFWADGTLTKAHYDYVQATWDLLAELKPEAQRAHHDIYGYYFNEITAEPVHTPFGTYAGGYFPASYDPFLDDDAARREDRATIEASPNSFMFPSTGRGFTRSRVDAYARPLSLDLRLVPLHIDKVLRFIHLQGAVRDAGRLLLDKGVRAALRDLDPTVAGDLLAPFLQRAAQQSVDTTTATGWGGRGTAKFFRALRRNTGLQIMAGNVKNALEQSTGLLIAATAVPPRALARALWRLARHPMRYAADVAEASVFMQTRTHSQVLEIQAQIDDLILNPSKYERGRTYVRQHSYILQSMTQNLVDLITWGGAYETATRGGATQPDAVARADAAVRQTQGSFNPEDVSRFEAGSPLVRALSMFFSFFNNLANLQATQYQVTVRELGLRRGAGRLLYVYTLGFMLPAVLSEVLTRAMRGDEWDEDGDGVFDDVLALFFSSQARTATAMLPVVGSVAQSSLNIWNEERFDDRISVSPAVSALESLARAPHSVYEAVVNDGRRKTAIRDALTSIGLLTGLPTAALGRPLGYLADVAEGEEPEGPLDAARGLVQGR